MTYLKLIWNRPGANELLEKTLQWNNQCVILYLSHLLTLQNMDKDVTHFSASSTYIFLHLLHIFLSYHESSFLGKNQTLIAQKCACLCHNGNEATTLWQRGDNQSCHEAIPWWPNGKYRHGEILINSLAPGKIEWNFRSLIFQIISVIDGWGISCELTLRWMSLDLTNDKSTLVQVMAWCRQATRHYLNQCWPKSVSPNGVTRPQWVNVMTIYQTRCSIFHQWPLLMTRINFYPSMDK